MPARCCFSVGEREPLLLVGGAQSGELYVGERAGYKTLNTFAGKGRLKLCLRGVKELRASPSSCPSHTQEASTSSSLMLQAFHALFFTASKASRPTYSSSKHDLRSS
jgi:hypothetical protein